MKTKTLIILSIVWVTHTACNADMDLGFLKDIPSVEGYQSLKLTDVEWKLIGFVDAKQDDIRMIESGSGKYFTLLFNDNNTLSGWSSSNELVGSYKISSKSSITIGIMAFTKVGEVCDGKLYIEYLNNVKTFSMTEKGLALYYDKNKFLLFKPI
jgi:META domain.